MLIRFSFDISHVPGKDLIVAIALSSAPTSSTTVADNVFRQEVDMFVNLIISEIGEKSNIFMCQ